MSVLTTDSSSNARKRLLVLIVNAREYQMSCKLDHASVRSLKQDIAGLSNGLVDELIEDYTPATGPRCVW